MLLACAELARSRNPLVRSLLMSRMQRLQMSMGGLLDLLGVTFAIAMVLRGASEKLVVLLERKDCLRPADVCGAWVMRRECEQHEKFLSYLERRFWSLGCCVGVLVVTQTVNMKPRMVNACDSHARQKLRVCYSCG
jgi:hypothetical protein